MINKLISEEKQKKLKEVKDPYQIRDAYIEAIGEFIIIQVMLI
jgi:sporulation protein YlmC with PRC-barrel domain